MSDSLIITNDDSEWPLASGRMEGNGHRTWWRSLHGDPDSGKLKQDVSGLKLSKASTNERLSVDMILWLLSRIRGVFADPDGKEICIWMNKYHDTASIAIGSSVWAYRREEVRDTAALIVWLNEALEKNSHNFKGK